MVWPDWESIPSAPTIMANAFTTAAGRRKKLRWERSHRCHIIAEKRCKSAPGFKHTHHFWQALCVTLNTRRSDIRVFGDRFCSSLRYFEKKNRRTLTYSPYSNRRPEKSRTAVLYSARNTRLVVFNKRKHVVSDHWRHESTNHDREDLRQRYVLIAVHDWSLKPMERQRLRVITPSALALVIEQ